MKVGKAWVREEGGKWLAFICLYFITHMATVIMVIYYRRLP